MTLEDVYNIRHRGQLKTDRDVADHAMLIGAAFAGYCHFPLSIKNCMMLGAAALQCLPTTPEDSLAGLLVPLADLPNPHGGILCP